MTSNSLLIAIIGLPLISFLLTLILPKSKETWISRVAFVSVVINFVLICILVGVWMYAGSPVLNYREVVIYRSEHYEFLIDFMFNHVTAVYLVVGAFVTLIITRYSSYYMHLEAGYKRFFNTILFFYLGYNFTIVSGNFETLFIGWEILGFSSFLLIAFYRDRYLPVRNAVKVFSIYRIGDVGILIAMWASHHLWQENISFVKLGNYELVHDQLASHSVIGLVIAISLLIAAAAKSAQLPFSSWLPRAMEGPTPSSAIFYGALSVHLGLFLLIRTEPFWEQQTAARVLIGVVGGLTAVIAFFIARVQSTIKVQIAYASIAQIGLMFIEIAFGLTTFVLIHFAGNAFLRTYQLLISPSIVSYAIREQHYNFKKRNRLVFSGRLKRLEYTLYVLASNEWGLDRFLNKYIFRTLKRLGKKSPIKSTKALWIWGTLLSISGISLSFLHSTLPLIVQRGMPYVYFVLALLFVLQAFSERKSAMYAWLSVFLAHVWIAVGVSVNEHFEHKETYIFLSGFVVSFIVGAICLQLLKKKEPTLDLNGYHGHVYDYRTSALVFLLSAMGLMGFPITLSFIGEDLILSHVHSDQFVLAFAYALTYIIGGIAIVRIYARTYLGPQLNKTHQTALKTA